MGSTLEAVSTVLATFMAGLGLGSVLAARYVDRQPTSKLPRLYVVLESGIGFAGLVFPALLSLSTPLFRELYVSTGDGTGLALARIATSMALLVPTTLMGATLPTLTALRERVVQKEHAVGRSAGLLYAANTFGAVVGSLGTGVFLLYWLGLAATTLVAVTLNGLAAMVMLVARFEDTSEAPESSPDEREEQGRAAGPVHIVPPWAGLSVIALSGFAALGSEVAWTRAIVLLIGPTTYGFSFIVSSVILGIALGSAVAARWATRRSWWLLASVQLAAGVASLVLVRVIGSLPIPVGELVRDNAGDAVRLLRVELAWVFALLVVPSFLFGAAFPLAVEVVAGRGSGRAAYTTGRTYAWNTLGAVAGSLLIGFFVLPSAGAESSLYVCAGAHVFACALLLVSSPAMAPVARWGLAGLLLASTSVAYRTLPHWDRELMSGGLYKYAADMEPGEFLDFLRRGELLYYEEDRVATVSVKKVGRRVSLAIDGKVDATNADDMLTQRMLAHTPLLLHPEPRRVLVIGFGSGVTAGSVLTHPVETVEAVEISTGVAGAEEFFREVNHDVVDDPRFTFRIADGRNHLLLTEEPYDVIISEPSNPWMAGVSGLFTRDFFSLARERLTPDGLFCQWAHIYNLSEEDLKTIVAGFTDVFEDTALFLLSEADILLVGAADEMELPSRGELWRRMSEDAVRQDLQELGVFGLYGFGALYAVSTPELAQWAADATRHTDDHPVLEFGAARSMHAATGGSNRDAIVALRKPSGVVPRFRFLEVEPTVEDLLNRALVLEGASSFEWAFEIFSRVIAEDPGRWPAYEGLVHAALALGVPERAEGALRSANPSVETNTALGLLYKNVSDPDAALVSLAEALREDPDAREALFMAAELEGDRGELASMVGLVRRILTRDPLDAEAAALLAEASLRAGNAEAATSQAEAILAERADEPRALQVVAIAQAQVGNTEEARKAFETLIGLEPEAWVHLNNFGRLELEAKNFERAAALFEKAVDLNPRSVVGYQGLEQAAELSGDAIRLERARSMLRFLERSTRSRAATFN